MFSSLLHFWHSLNDFQKARLKLTGLYIALIFVILNIFTLSLFFVLQKEELIHQQKIQTLWHQKEIVFPDKKITIVTLSTPQKNSITTQEVINLHQIFLEIIQKWILVIEGILLLISGVLSYFLSGKTLRPIEEKNKRQREFLSDVSHELKNPLSALKTSLEISAQQKDWKHGEVQEVFSDLKSEIDRLIHTTEDLLFLEKKNFHSEKTKIFLPEIIEKIQKRFTGLLQKKNIEYISHIENFSGSADEKELEKVIANIVHNAIKFSPPNSKIIVSLTEKGKFSVQDFGVGIAKKDLSHIFERFYKVDDSRVFTEENGSGLGLSLVKKICDANKWKISVNSEEKKGTIVVIDFL